MTDRQLTLYRVHGNNLSRPGRPPAAAAETAEKTRLRSAALAEEILRRIPETASERTRSMVEQFRRHQLARAGYPRDLLLRTWRIFREILTGRYRRYSSGWRSVAADWLLFR